MTERIDLDDIDAGEADEDGPNPGDWFWREEGDPPDEPEAVTEIRTAATTDSADTEPESADSSDDLPDDEAESAADAADSVNAAAQPMPRVPRENDDKPVGVPVESGGAGGAPAGASDADAPEADPDEESTTESEPAEATPASGPHGGGADDMTMAFTYGAATRLADFGRVAADAAGWTDWLGLVGDVPAHVINKFQRDQNVDLDFFNGSARGPGERLAGIDRHSMFYAERMVVVGVEGEDEAVAAKADWEFVPLSKAAEKAGWEIEE